MRSSRVRGPSTSPSKGELHRGEQLDTIGERERFAIGEARPPDSRVGESAAADNPGQPDRAFRR